jgi:hypothetical protein
MNAKLNDVPSHPWLGAPIDARPLFAPEQAALMTTLRGLAPADWAKEALPGWTVRDLAAHVLGDFYGLPGTVTVTRKAPPSRRAKLWRRSSTASTRNGSTLSAG